MLTLTGETFLERTYCIKLLCTMILVLFIIISKKVEMLISQVMPVGCGYHLQLSWECFLFQLNSEPKALLIIHCLGRIQAEEKVLLCFVLQLCPKEVISRSGKEDRVHRNLGKLLSRKTTEISWILLLFARRYYLSPNSIHAAGCLFSPGVILHSKYTHQLAPCWTFLPSRWRLACNEEGVGQKT